MVVSHIWHSATAPKPPANFMAMSNPMVDEEKMTTDGLKALMRSL
jgi:hypothetical protein